MWKILQTPASGPKFAHGKVQFFRELQRLSHRFLDDGSLQSVLVKSFFSNRQRDGILTRLEIRDGAGRLPEGDAMSLRSVGSRIFHPRDRNEAPKPHPKSRRSTIVRWLGLGKTPTPSKPSVSADGTETAEDGQELAETPQKVGGTRLFPNIFFAFSSRKATPVTPE